MLAVDAAIRHPAMTESLTNERVSQPEFEAFYLGTARVLHGYLCRLSRDSGIAGHGEVSAVSSLRDPLDPPE